MAGVLRVEPHSAYDLRGLIARCKEKKYVWNTAPDGCLDIDYEASDINRISLIDDLKQHGRFDLGVAAMHEKLDLLVDLLELKKPKVTLETQVMEAINATGILTESKLQAEFSPENRNIFVIRDHMDDKFVRKIAKALGVHDGGNPKKIGPDCYAAYVQGDALTFYRHLSDYKADFE